MASILEELDKLRIRARKLEAEVAQQRAISANNPQVRVGNIVEDTSDGGTKQFTIRETNVAAEKQQEHLEVTVLPGDPGPPGSEQPVAFHVDENGVKYILPSGNRIIMVEDLGGTTGRNIEKDANNNIIVPENTETLSLIVAEPDTFFHGGIFPLKTGRIYMGMKLVGIGGSPKVFLVFVAGFGNVDKTFTVNLVVADTDTITLDLETDGAGKVVNLTGLVS